MKSRDFNPILADYVWGSGSMYPNDHDEMDEAQQDCVHKIDLARAYKKRKNG